jgi:translation initiation factor 1 (eIF-1/SUI1)
MDPKKLLKQISGKNDDDLTEIDKKIHIKIFKDGNRMKTEVSGLDDFMKVDNFKQFAKEIKELHGCSGIVSEKSSEIKGKKVIFSGNQIENVRNYIIKKGITTIEFIK